ncbi:hypothetical protein [Fulvimonas soli]|uniref:Uncharacterized protein n=1 Tax=Fulvimonas soli TaxID=155197 RepID=A0A316I3G9_9GAMM|nr:hypothetical protein [Fulvimonas soli]PWK81853.1 hypothetical protein C7456_1188 [Fulvimonas soli]
MATRKRRALDLEGLVEKYGIAALAALRNPALWDVIVPMGPGRGVPSVAARKQLQRDLDQIYGVLLANAKAGDAISGTFAAQIAVQRAAIRRLPIARGRCRVRRWGQKAERGVAVAACLGAAHRRGTRLHDATAHR